MIVFDLRCGHGHSFEGWFASGDEFLRQKEASMVHCPVCDDAAVDRLPSAKVRVRKALRAVPPDEPKTEAPVQDAIAGFPPELVARLREVVRNTEDVGERFAEEARKIHYEETPARPIRGKASSEDAEALTEEGIDFSALPPFLTRETH
ncbi:MAG: DUF1178 family protein [Betaproteobacteria bacterium]